MTTSTNGTNWTAVARIPIDSTGSKLDHFIPGLVVCRRNEWDRSASLSSSRARTQDATLALPQRKDEDAAIGEAGRRGVLCNWATHH